jgi:dTDP-4-dehydrorhamnose reductase
LKVLVTGAEGQLGKACVDLFELTHEVIPVDIKNGDLTVEKDIKKIFNDCNPDWVLHCAAWTDVDGAEADKSGSMSGNAVATKLLVDACRQIDAGITLISTDYVFPGDNTSGYFEADKRSPINWYGNTKLEAEKAVEGYGQIVRTSWLFGHGPNNFVVTMRKLFASHPTIKVVDDQIGSPTYTVDLAEILLFLVNDKTPGIYHGTNSGQCSWFEFAKEIASISGYKPEKVTPCSSDDFPTIAKRPACSVLKSSYLESLGYSCRPSWQDAVKRYIDFIVQEQQ